MNTYLSQIEDGVITWLEDIRCKEAGWGRWPYHAAMRRPWAVISSAWAISVYDILGSLKNISAEQKNEAICFLQSCQDSNDGYFKDPLVTEEDHLTMHSWEDIWGQMNTAEVALKLLGAHTLYPMPVKSFAKLGEVNISECILNLGWVNPWHVGERFYRMIISYINTLPAESDILNDSVLNEVFDVYENNILDKISGLPSKYGCEDSSVAMAGLFKVIFAYNAAGRIIPCAENAIDSVLKLQHDDGEIGFRKNMCINWDSVWVLRELNRQMNGTYKFDLIKNYGNKLADCLLSKYLKDDGGFAFNRDLCVGVHHSVKLSDELPIGDVMGTMMAVKSLLYADEWNDGKISQFGNEM